MKIAIIGAGPGGLAAARHCLEDKLNCTIFEQTGTIGGTWNYVEKIGLDEFGLPIHSSMYKDLRTNLPKELMEFEKFPYDSIYDSFIKQSEVLKYLHRFVDTFDIKQYIKFYSYVQEIDPLPNSKWQMKIVNLLTDSVETYVFDGVIVSNGHGSVPRSPHVEGIENFQGSNVHSHMFRTSQQYIAKNVLILGSGPSALDISRIISEVASNVYVSHRTPAKSKFGSKIISKPWVKRFNNSNVVEFGDNTTAKIDDIIFCTGYQYSLPFITPNCGVKVENNCIQPLYKHLINIEHPTMAFIGLLFPICPFIVFGIQVKFLLKIFKQKITISKKEMLEDFQNDIKERMKQGFPSHYGHKLLVAQNMYLDDLCDIGNIEKIPSVYQKLYKRVTDNRNLEDVFRIVNDEQFIQIA